MPSSQHRRLLKYMPVELRRGSDDILIDRAASAALALARADANRISVMNACLVPDSNDPACKCGAAVHAVKEAMVVAVAAGKALDDVLTKREVLAKRAKAKR